VNQGKKACHQYIERMLAGFSLDAPVDGVGRAVFAKKGSFFYFPVNLPSSPSGYPDLLPRQLTLYPVRLPGFITPINFTIKRNKSKDNNYICHCITYLLEHRRLATHRDIC
jgi:hypothetical protein